MCEAGLIVTAVVSAIQILEEDKAQGKQVKYQNEFQAITEANAAGAATGQYGALLEQERQVRQAAAVDIQRAGVESQHAIAAATVGLAEAGTGSSVLSDVTFSIGQQAADFQAVRQRNLDNDTAQIMRSLEGIRAGHANTNLQGVGKHIAGPDYVGILGNLLSSGVEAYNSSRASASKDRQVPGFGGNNNDFGGELG